MNQEIGDFFKLKMNARGLIQREIERFGIVKDN
jgi:hypothetical protein